MVLGRIKLNLKLMMASSDSSTSLSIAHAAMDNKLITSKIYYKFYFNIFNSILILTKLYFCLKNSPSHSYYMTKTIFLIYICYLAFSGSTNVIHHLYVYKNNPLIS